MEFQEIFYIGVNIFNLLVYIVFVMYVITLLRKNNQSLDIYMKLTLTLIGFSILLLVLDDFDKLYDNGYLSSIRGVRWGSLPQQTIEKIGIFFDIARLTIIVLTYKYQSQVRTKICYVKLATALAIAIAIAMVAYLEYVNYQLQQIVANYNDSMYDILMQKYEEFLLMILIYSIFTNLGIITAYLTTYLVL